MVTSKTPPIYETFPLSKELKAEADKFRTLVGQAKQILISSTLTSDGDSIGAQLGLFHLINALRGSDSGIYMVDHSPVPDRYSFLKGADRIVSIDDFKKSGSKINFDLGITCDGGVERTGSVEPLFKDIKNTILVDHHAVGSKLKYTSTILDPEASSTCELIYHLYEHMNLPLPAYVAESLYVGIVFDTGFFKHSLTKPRTHIVASKLIETGIDFSKISDRALLERSWEAQLLLKSLLDNVERSASGRIVSSHWSLKDLEAINPKDGDQEGMINQLYYTEGAQVIALFTEAAEGKVKISFRSKGTVNVADFARTLYPDGGGHIRASGCMMTGSLTDVKKTVLEKLQKIL